MLKVTKILVDTQNQSFGGDVPNGCRVLRCGIEGDDAYLYVAGDDQALMSSKTFIAVQTEQEIPYALHTLTYLGSVNPAGTVFHVFDTNQ